MTFVCAKCRYRVALGYGPWDDCAVCNKVQTVLKDAPPYVPDYRPMWRTPVVREFGWAENLVEEDEAKLRQKIAAEHRKAYEELDKWWKHLHSVRLGDYEGTGDPQLSFECFNDFTYSPELRTKLREQVNVEFSLMPDLDDIDDPGPGLVWWKGKNRRWK